MAIKVEFGGTMRDVIAMQVEFGGTMRPVIAAQVEFGGVMKTFWTPLAAPSGLNYTDNSLCGFGDVPEYNVDLDWTLGDASAATVIKRNGTIIATVPAGTNFYNDTGGGSGSRTYELYHSKDGSISASVSRTVSIPNPCV